MGYNIKLDVFEGPLDLLLHLIKEHEVDIYDIPIAMITEQYLEFIDVIKSLNLDIAGDYLLMASQLTYIKSKLLLPKHEQEEDALDEGEDPREELVAKLIEYKKFKEAAQDLKMKELEQTRVFTRTPTRHEIPDEADLLTEVNVFELLKSFKKVLDQYSGEQQLSVSLEEISVTDKINEIMARLEKVDYITFDALFQYGRNRAEVVATFLAMLELMRLRLMRVNQTRLAGEIIIYGTADEENGTSELVEPEEDFINGGGANHNDEPSYGNNAIEVNQGAEGDESAQSQREFDDQQNDDEIEPESENSETYVVSSHEPANDRETKDKKSDDV